MYKLSQVNIYPDDADIPIWSASYISATQL